MNFKINLYPDIESFELCFDDSVFFFIDGGLRADGKIGSLSAWDHPNSELDAAWEAIPDDSLDDPANYGFVDLCDFWILQDVFNLDADLLERVEQAASAVTTHDAMKYSKIVYALLCKLLLDSKDKNYEEAMELQEEWCNKLTELCEQFGIETEYPEADE